MNDQKMLQTGQMYKKELNNRVDLEVFYKNKIHLEEI